MEETMQSVRAHVRGGPEVLMVERAPRPVAAPGEALVQVEAASITPTELSWNETYVDASGRPRTPTIPSHEVAGRVFAIGQGVDDLSIGEAVFGLVDFDRNGAAAEFVSVPARALAPAPRTIDALTAAAVPLAGLSAWQALFTHGGLRSGQRVLVHGGAGGVGMFVIQLAHDAGAHVSTTVRARDAEFVRDLGADEVLDRDAVRFEEVIAPVDLVIDLAGGDTLARSFGMIVPGGALVSLVEPPSPELARRHELRAASYFIVEPDRDQLVELARRIDAGRLRVVIDRVFPLAETRSAFEYARSAHHRGKIVLEVQHLD
jgi:NADPH:quinone reductase-like Zn-dependent oxidoreductase